MTRSRLLLFYLIAIAGSLLIALLAAELFVRTRAFSTADGGGQAAQRWNRENWLPLNSEGYRDDEWQPPGDKPALVFLGDSFTDGHGVGFDETYYHRVRTALADTYAAYNIGYSGASTRDERNYYRQFRKKSGVAPKRVVLQYFGNDMGDLLPPAPTWKPWPGLAALSAHSELAELLWLYMEGVRWGRLYADHHLDAYADPAVFGQHRADLHRLFDDIHASDARLVFVVFPYLDNEDYLDKSVHAYLGRMRKVFDARCRAGDLFLDVAPLARSVPLPERTVNRLDGHPSPRLHALVAERIVGMLQADAVPTEAGVAACPRNATAKTPAG